MREREREGGRGEGGGRKREGGRERKEESERERGREGERKRGRRERERHMQVSSQCILEYTSMYTTENVKFSRYLKIVVKHQKNTILKSEQHQHNIYGIYFQ